MGKRLVGKRALITGAGQGIGRAIATAFADEGAHVVATSRSLGKLAGLAGDRVEVVALDVADPAQIAAVTDAVAPVDVLVNCAGYVAPGTILDCDEETWGRSFEVNATAAYRMIRAVLPGMLSLGGGSIVNVASVASSVTGVADRCAYGASKAALIGLTKAVARDFVDRGIRCNALCPGTTASPSLETRIAQTPDPSATRASFVERQPMGRLGEPAEMAEAAVFLAGDGCRFMTGQLVTVDGGQTL